MVGYVDACHNQRIFFSCFFNLCAHAQREINNKIKGEQQNWRVQLCLKANEGDLLFFEGDLL